MNEFFSSSTWTRLDADGQVRLPDIVGLFIKCRPPSYPNEIRRKSREEKSWRIFSNSPDVSHFILWFKWGLCCVNRCPHPASFINISWLGFSMQNAAPLPLRYARPHLGPCSCVVWVREWARARLSPCRNNRIWIHHHHHVTQNTHMHARNARTTYGIPFWWLGKCFG